MMNSPLFENRSGRLVTWDSRARASKKSGALLTHMSPLKIYATDAYDAKNFPSPSREMRDHEDALHPDVVVLESLAVSNVRAILRKEQRTVPPRKMAKFVSRFFDVQLKR